MGPACVEIVTGTEINKYAPTQKAGASIEINTHTGAKHRTAYNITLDKSRPKS